MKIIIKQIISNPLFSGSAIMIIGSNSVNFLNYLFHLLMIRMLNDPVDYGELASLISLMGLLGVIPQSFSLVIIKYISSANTKDEVESLISWFKRRILHASIIFCILIIILSPIITSFLNLHKLSYTILIAISFLFSLQALLNRSILQGLLKFKEMVITILLENSAKLILSILVVLLGFAVGGVMLALTLSAVFGWYGTLFYLKYKSKPDYKVLPNKKKMLLFSLPVLIQSFAVTSLYSSDVILVKHFFSSYEAGLYAFLSTLGKIIFFGTGPIGAVMFPLVSKRFSKREDFRKIFIYSLLGTGLLASTILIIYALIPGFVIKLLGRSSYLEAAPYLIWFGIFITLFTLSTLLINYGLSLNKIKIVIFPLIAAILQIILIWFFHQSLLMVIIISIGVSALLLIALLIYSSIWKLNSSR